MQKKYDLNFLIKYPFLKEAKEYAASLNIKLSDIQNHPLYSAAVDAAAQRLRNALENKKNDFDDEFPEIVVLSFPVARIIANLTNNKTIIKKFANREAVQASKFLERETHENLIKITDELNLNFRDDKIHFMDYLKFTSRIAKYDDNFKLVNRFIENGFVKIDKEDKLVIIREAVKLKILEPIDTKKIPDNFKNLARTINAEVSGGEGLKVERVNKDALPPCITSMLSSLAAGEVSHNSMFTLATFFINLNLDIDEIVKLFAAFPKFNEQKTKYHIEFLAGMKSNTRYTCPACATIKSYGLCPVEHLTKGQTDCGVMHPLHYYKDHTKKKGKEVKKEK